MLNQPPPLELWRGLLLAPGDSLQLVRAIDKLYPLSDTRLSVLSVLVILKDKNESSFINSFLIFT